MIQRRSFTAATVAAAALLTGGGSLTAQEAPEGTFDPDVVLRELRLSQETEATIAPLLEELSRIADQRAGVRQQGLTVRDQLWRLLDELDRNLTPEERWQVWQVLWNEGAVGLGPPGGWAGRGGFGVGMRPRRGRGMYMRATPGMGRGRWGGPGFRGPGFRGGGAWGPGARGWPCPWYRWDSLYLRDVPDGPTNTPRSDPPSG